MDSTTPFDRRLQLVPCEWRNPLADVLDTAETVRLKLQEWKIENADTLIALTRLVLARRDQYQENPYIADDVEYTPVNGHTGIRAVVVVDRGWIFAGDVTREDGRIKISRAVWVFRWESCGFSKVIEDPSNADIRPMADVDMPAGAEIFSVPVPDNWGL